MWVMHNPTPLLLPRSDLLNRLRARPLVPLAVLNAPAGFGKTTLLGQLRQALLADGASVALLVVEPADIARTASVHGGRGLQGRLRSDLPSSAESAFALADDPGTARCHASGAPPPSS